MTKTKVTKKALVSSFLALMLCVSMLLGATYAWFTDNVTSTGNIIKSGTLDVSMKWADGTEDPSGATWTDAASGAIFNYDLWEPGYTEVRHIKISNDGTLALKYKVQIVANGTVSDLADVIDVYYMDPAEQIADRAALATKTPMGTLTQALAGMDATAAGRLAAGEADTITIALKMQESAGNEYQDKPIGTDFSVQLLATQDTVEADSFDNQYDANATLPALSTVAFQNAISSASAGAIIHVGNTTVNLAQTDVTPAGASIAGEGADKTTLHIVANNGDGYKITNEDVSISGVHVDGSEVTSGGYNSLLNVEKDGVVISDSTFTGGGLSTWNSSILVENIPVGGTFTLKNSNVTGSFRGILRESCGANIVVDNCDIDAVYPINIDGGSTPSYLVVSNSKLHGWTSYSSITSATFTNTEFSKANSGYDVVAAYVDTAFENCTFDSEFDVYAQTVGITFTFNNCTKNGVAVTADNFKTLFTDSDVWVKCTCIVNGVQVTA